MKKLILAVAIFSLAFPAAQRAKAADISIDFFYNNLNQGGNWIEVGDYGYCWQPSVAVSNPGWRPYSDGYWAYTNVGWTWVSYEDFGWATYHYGRWSRLRNHGWVWMPGREWGPAWVSWRTGGDYVGWAPLPPRYGASGRELVYQGRPISNTVDIDFDIGPAYYNFVNVRYIGEPVLRDRIFAPTQNITYINQTVNVTNIRYDNSTVYNYGPDYNRLAAYSTRPIRRMTLERQSNVDYGAALRTGSLTKVEGDRLVVAAPQRLEALSPQQQVTPKAVKTRIAKPEVETGWTGISNPKAKAELQQKMRKENPRSVPPSQRQPSDPVAAKAASPTPNATGSSNASAGSSPAPAVSPGAASPPPPVRAVKGKRGRAQQADQPSASPTAAKIDANAPASPGMSPVQTRGRDRDRKRGTNQPAQPTAAPTVSSQAGVATESTPNQSVAPNEKNNGRRGRGQTANVAPATAPQGGVNNNNAAVPRNDRPDRPAAGPSNGDKSGLGAARKRENAGNAPAVSDSAASQPQAQRQAAPQPQERKAERQMRQGSPQQSAPANAQAAPKQGDSPPERGKKGKKAKEEPSPTPGQ